MNEIGCAQVSIRQNREALFDRRPGRRLTLNCVMRATTSRVYHSGEERPLVAETGIDRWLSRARGVGDFVDAGTFKSALHEYLARRIEDALVNLSKLLRLGGQRHA